MDVIKPFRWYKKEEIESLAANLRLQVENKRTRYLRADSVAEAVADFLELNIMWDSISADGKGEIAAMIFPMKQMVIINSDIPELKGGFRQSTIAHEIGHWMLHINRQTVEKYIDRWNEDIETKIQPFLCRNIQSSAKIEWQAQYFASCLLMPKYKLIESLRGRDLTNWKHLYAIADELGVTISNLKNRLKYLEWIDFSSSSKQIYLGKAYPKNNL